MKFAQYAYVSVFIVCLIVISCGGDGGNEVGPNLPVEQPDVEQPDVEQPDVEQPDVEQPDVEQPDVEQPDVEQPDLVVQSLSVSDSNLNVGQPFMLSATVGNQGDGQSAATTLRYYRSSDATISSEDTEIGMSAVGILSAPHTDPPRGSGKASFDLDQQGEAEGITYANGRLYVVDYFDGKVYVYRTDGQRDSAADFDLDPQNTEPTGITYANGRFYVVGQSGGKVYAYQADGQRDSAADFDLDPLNESPSGITYAENGFYVVGYGPLDDGISFGGSKVYAYRMDGGRDSAADFDLVEPYDSPEGITYANGRFYVVNSGDEGYDDKVYAYRTDGQRDSAADFDLEPLNEGPQGIVYANGRFYVTNDFPVKVYIYPSSDSGSTDDSSASNQSISLTAPSSPGTYYYGACIDSVPGESDAENNCSSAVTLTVEEEVLPVNYGALGFDLFDDCGYAFGISYNYVNEENALGDAIDECVLKRGSRAECAEKSSAYSQCAALAYGYNSNSCWIGSAFGSSENTARSTAFSECNSDNPAGYNCSVVESACNTASSSDSMPISRGGSGSFPTSPPSDSDPLDDFNVEIPSSCPRQVRLCVRDHQCEDGDEIEVKVNGNIVFSGELFNSAQCVSVPVQEGVNPVSLLALNGTGFKGFFCSHSDANTGEIQIHGGATQRWRHRGGAGSTANLNVIIGPPASSCP